MPTVASGTAVSSDFTALPLCKMRTLVVAGSSSNLVNIAVCRSATVDSSGREISCEALLSLAVTATI